MNSITMAYGRVPTLLQWQSAARGLGIGNSNLARVQIQLATGRSMLRPSDDALGAGAVSVLDSLLEAQRQRSGNLTQGGSMLSLVDSALSEAVSLLLEAKGIGLDQSTSGVDPAERVAQAEAIDSILSRVFGLANSDHRGVYLFGGSATARTPYVDIDGMIQYLGRGAGLISDLGLASDVPVTLGGAAAFGAVSTRVEGHRDLDPDVDMMTRLTDLNGAVGEGVTLGIIEVNRNPPGGIIEVDLREAWTIQDVVDTFRTSAGLEIGIDPDGNGLTIVVPPGETVTISDADGDRIALDLGILGQYSGPMTVVGLDLDRRLTDDTSISALHFTPGTVRFSNGLQTVDLDMSGALTVGELRRLVEQMDLGIRLELSESGDRLDALNLRSGSLMSIGEVTGGSAATDLGIRSMDRETLLSDFNRGEGVSILEGNIDPVTGLPDASLDLDLAIVLSNGERVDVDLAGCVTVGDMLDRIRAEADATLSDPSLFSIQLAGEGNGIVIEDNSGGGGTLEVVTLNGSSAAWDLGLMVSATGATIVGEDRAQVAVEGAFTHMMDLRDALMADDVNGIALAVERLEADLSRLDLAQAEVGIRSRRLADALARNEDTIIMDEQLRSRILDLDYTEASIRFASLQQQLQAGLATAARGVSMTLLDYL